MQSSRPKRRSRRGVEPEIKPRRARTIGVFSCKGGVGKTTTVANISTKLSEVFERNVLSVDTNLSAPNLSIHLGELNPRNTIHDVIAGDIPVDEAIHNHGKLDAIYGSIAFGEDIHQVDLRDNLEPLKNKYKVIFLDTPPGMGSEVVSAIRACDEMIIITNPDTPTVASTLKTFQAAEKYKVPIFGTVVNRVLGKKFELPTQDVKKALGWPISAVIPENEKVRESTAEGVPVVKYAPESPAAKEFLRLSKTVENHLRES